MSFYIPQANSSYPANVYLPPVRKPTTPALTTSQQQEAIAKAQLTQTQAAKSTELKSQQKIYDNAIAKQKLDDALKANNAAALVLNPSDTVALAAYNAAVADKAKQVKIANDAQTKIKSLKADIASLTQILKPARTVIPPKRTTSVPTVTGDGAIKPPFKYKYNIPMIKSAYLGTHGPQEDSLSSKGSTKGNALYSDGRKAFESTSKGTIQMSQFLSQNVKITEAQKKNPNYDTNMYGFKFLYNPNGVTMSWGVVTDINPQLEAMGLDKSVSLTSALSSTISFDLVLNRMGDMNVIDQYGLKSSLTSANVYPQTVSNDELKLIYKKGTMYDLEYLFKTLNGFSSSYTSGLNGKTADWGWLYAIPVELHLGDGLRYLVRISSLDVEHKIFNERMVPTFTMVHLVCARYPDVANQQTTKK